MSNGPSGDRTHGRAIEALLDGGLWTRARWVIQERLVDAPGDHWLLAQLALTWIEEDAPDRALPILERALAIAPACPMVLWYYGAALDALGDNGRAVAVFRSLVERGVLALAEGECGLGRALAKSVMAHAYGRLHRIHGEAGRDEQARRCFDRFFDLLDPEEAAAWIASARGSGSRPTTIDGVRLRPRGPRGERGGPGAHQ